MWVVPRPLVHLAPTRHVGSLRIFPFSVRRSLWPLCSRPRQPQLAPRRQERRARPVRFFRLLPSPATPTSYGRSRARSPQPRTRSRQGVTPPRKPAPPAISRDGAAGRTKRTARRVRFQEYPVRRHHTRSHQDTGDIVRRTRQGGSPPPRPAPPANQKEPHGTCGHFGTGFAFIAHDPKEIQPIACWRRAGLAAARKRGAPLDVPCDHARFGARITKKKRTARAVPGVPDSPSSHAIPWRYG
jgi:hypothetical protein